MAEVSDALSFFVWEPLATVKYHYKEGNIDWLAVATHLFTHVMGFGGLYICTQIKKETWILSLVVLILTSLGVAVGAHRLWSHRSHKGTFLYRLVVMFMFSLSGQYRLVSSLEAWTPFDLID